MDSPAQNDLPLNAPVHFTLKSTFENMFDQIRFFEFLGILRAIWAIVHCQIITNFCCRCWQSNQGQRNPGPAQVHWQQIGILVPLSVLESKIILAQKTNLMALENEYEVF